MGYWANFPRIIPACRGLGLVLFPTADRLRGNPSEIACCPAEGFDLTGRYWEAYQPEFAAGHFSHMPCYYYSRANTPENSRRVCIRAPTLTISLVFALAGLFYGPSPNFFSPADPGAETRLIPSRAFRPVSGRFGTRMLSPAPLPSCWAPGHAWKDVHWATAGLALALVWPPFHWTVVPMPARDFRFRRVGGVDPQGPQSSPASYRPLPPWFDLLILLRPVFGSFGRCCLG